CYSLIDRMGSVRSNDQDVTNYLHIPRGVNFWIDEEGQNGQPLTELYNISRRKIWNSVVRCFPFLSPIGVRGYHKRSTETTDALYVVAIWDSLAVRINPPLGALRLGGGTLIGRSIGYPSPCYSRNE